jgi:hypothetical protein
VRRIACGFGSFASILPRPLAVIDEDSLSAFYCLEEIETDPKVWLDELNAGIDFARRTMPADDFHHQFLGAFKMAEVYLMRDWFKQNG